MSVLLLVLVIFPQTDEAFPQSLDTGRPKLEEQTTSAERMKKWRQNLNNKELENEKKSKISSKQSHKIKRKTKRIVESSKITRSENKRKGQEMKGTQW